MNEAETRAELIDPALKAAGCGVVEGSRVRPRAADSLADAIADLGEPEQIGEDFGGFQKYLYVASSTA